MQPPLKNPGDLPGCTILETTLYLFCCQSGPGAGHLWDVGQSLMPDCHSTCRVQPAPSHGPVGPCHTPGCTPSYLNKAFIVGSKGRRNGQDGQEGHNGEASHGTSSCEWGEDWIWRGLHGPACRSLPTWGNAALQECSKAAFLPPTQSVSVSAIAGARAFGKLKPNKPAWARPRAVRLPLLGAAPGGCQSLPGAPGAAAGLRSGGRPPGQARSLDTPTRRAPAQCTAARRP